MNIRPKVSVIMPSLNVGMYIRECIESVVNQTIREIEIFCVDAGSTDGTLEVLQEYAAKDSRVQVILSEKKSYGYQMNLGLDAASGEYIGIVETDDFVKPDMFEKLYAQAKEMKLDWIKADFYRFVNKEKGNGLRLTYNQLIADMDLYGKVFTPNDDMRTYRHIMNIWSGIYHTDWIREHEIRFNETPGASYQDNGFFFQTMALAQRASFVHQPYYMNRRDNPNSSVHNRAKVYCMNEEYVYIRDFLGRHPQLEAKLMPIYQWKKYHSYNFTFNRIGSEFKWEYMESFSKEFKEARENGWLDQSLFTEMEWKDIQWLIDDPPAFYLRYSGFARAHVNLIDEMIYAGEIRPSNPLLRGMICILVLLQRLENYGQRFVRYLRKHGLVQTFRRCIQKIINKTN